MQSKDKSDPKATNPSREEIQGFNIKINEFGEVICTHEMNDINEFLDKAVKDKKLIDRQDVLKGDED
ncbi:MAG: hypothetical protein KJP00_16830 [Bacteroidia bacterium]|nr:hypothetical protein [Bacteroidia bacterium]